MAYADTGDDAELENEGYYFTMDKFLKKVFTLLDKISKRKLDVKEQSLLIIDSEDLFDFILDQTFYSNNVDIYITDAEFPEIWNEEIKTQNIDFLKSYYNTYIFIIIKCL